jgi:hypothetical protein
MGDVRLAALAQLSGVHPVGDLVGPADRVAVAVAVDTPVRPHEKTDRIIAYPGSAQGEPYPVYEIFNVP